MKPVTLCAFIPLLLFSGCYVVPQPAYVAAPPPPPPPPYYAPAPGYYAPAPAYYGGPAYYSPPVSFGVGIGGGGYWRHR